MSKLAPYAKAVGALLGGLTPAVVIWILALAGVHVDQSVAVGICAALGAVGAYVAPSNQPATPPAPPTT